MKDFTRSITITKVQPVIVEADGAGNVNTTTIDPMEIIGKLNEIQALKVVRKIYPKAVLASICSYDVKYSISPEDLMKYGKKL